MYFFPKTLYKKKIIYKLCDFLILIFRDDELAGWVVAYLHTILYGIFWFFGPMGNGLIWHEILRGLEEFSYSN